MTWLRCLELWPDIHPKTKLLKLLVTLYKLWHISPTSANLLWKTVIRRHRLAFRNFQSNPDSWLYIKLYWDQEQQGKKQRQHNNLRKIGKQQDEWWKVRYFVVDLRCCDKGRYKSEPGLYAKPDSSSPVPKLDSKVDPKLENWRIPEQTHVHFWQTNTKT